jgi:hypothetical protein
VKTEPVKAGARRDDLLTVCAIGALAFMAADVLHEGCGHAVTAYFSGARLITMSTVAMSSDIATRWISAAGTLVNLVSAAVFYVALRASGGRVSSGRADEVSSGLLQYFLWCAMTFNLLDGTGYFIYSGVSNFGDWAEVGQGWEPHWAWRAALIVTGVVTYIAATWWAARTLREYFVPTVNGPRVRRLTASIYFTAGILECVAAAFNQVSWTLILLSGAAATFGGLAGLLWMPALLQRRREGGSERWILRSWGWIATGAIAALLFVLVLGRGITFHPHGG